MHAVLDKLLGLFRRAPPIDSLPALDDFLDSHAAFNAQKCIVEYARARAGVLAAKLFKEEAFMAAVNHARWHGYTVTLSHMCEMADAALRDEAGEQRLAVLEGLMGCIDRIIARYDIPPGEPASFWLHARDTIDKRMAHVGLRPPRKVKDIPLDTVQQIFDVLPIHKSLRGHDYELVQNNLRGNLIRAYETFVTRADRQRLVQLLGAGK